MSKTTIGGVVVTLAILGMLPFALIARSRASLSDRLPVHLVLDMDKQPKFKAQRGTPLFADGRSMRPQVPGTFAREDAILKSELLNDAEKPGVIELSGGMSELRLDETSYAAVMLGRVRPAGMTDAQFNAVKPPNGNDQEIANDKVFYLQKIPAQFEVNAAFLKRGQERFNIYCLPCHGESGYGDGPIARRAADLAVQPDTIVGWAPPQNLQEAKIHTRPDGHIFNTITNGVRSMPAYDKQISVADRWAIVAYLRALQVSQNPPAAAVNGAGK